MKNEILYICDRRKCKNCSGWCDHTTDISHADNFIKNGSIFVEQDTIIRCKECKWFNTSGCAIEIIDDSDRPTENDFCSFAERKEANNGTQL